MDTSALDELENWFQSQCDGNWEHDSGILIQTLDNPGWSVHINLENTSLMDAPFTEVRENHSEIDWMHCRRSEKSFEGYGGPLKLGAILRIFLTWAQEHLSK